MCWIKSKRDGTTYLLNCNSVMRFEGRVVDGQAVLFCYLADVEGKDYARVFSTPNIPKGAALLDKLVAFLAMPSPTSLVFDVEAEAALL